METIEVEDEVTTAREHAAEIIHAVSHSLDIAQSILSFGEELTMNSKLHKIMHDVSGATTVSPPPPDNR
jgi:ubiquinone/menaquinone biosynthesis C-methylase UbiE